MHFRVGKAYFFTVFNQYVTVDRVVDPSVSIVVNDAHNSSVQYQNQMDISVPEKHKPCSY